MSSRIRYVAVALIAGAALSVAACNEDKAANKAADAAKEAAKATAGKVEAAKETVKDAAKDAAQVVAQKTEAAKEAVKDAVAAAPAKVEAAKEAVAGAAATAGAAVVAAKDKVVEKAAEAAAPAKPAEPAAAAAPAAAASGDNAEVQSSAKEAAATFKDGRYRDKDGKPTPVTTKDYKVDWATWQGFRRYHDACHVCHGPNALGSTFAPSLGESLKTMDYETFFGIVVGGKISDRGGTKYVMPAFGEDKNIMCYLDDIYTYIKARSNNMVDPKKGMPAGRPNGREDISPEAKKAASDCTG